MENILFLAHTESGTLPKIAFETLSAAAELAKQSGGTLAIALFGADVQQAANAISNCGAARILAASNPELAQARYASDAAACEALCRAANASIVIAPSTSRMARVLSGVAHRLNGCVDTHITGIGVLSGAPTVTRWFYRQRIEGSLQRSVRPWLLLAESGCAAAYRGAAGTATVEMVDVNLPALRTKVTGVRAPQTSQQTIRPDAKILLVAGAGWTKKQADGQVHAEEAERLILDFLRDAKASLGSSKSLVEQSGENQAVLKFMSHLNQVGQTGATPRHPKGLSTCCHGEEPHVVGWRFINERRAVNLDPNCGWARGKADVLYVADAFEVMGRVNALLAQKAISTAAK